MTLTFHILGTEVFSVELGFPQPHRDPASVPSADTDLADDPEYLDKDGFGFAPVRQ